MEDRSRSERKTDLGYGGALDHFCMLVVQEFDEMEK